MLGHATAVMALELRHRLDADLIRGCGRVG
jgi:hypothetical protein